MYLKERIHLKKKKKKGFYTQMDSVWVVGCIVSPSLKDTWQSEPPEPVSVTSFYLEIVFVDGIELG